MSDPPATAGGTDLRLRYTRMKTLMNIIFKRVCALLLIIISVTVAHAQEGWKSVPSNASGKDLNAVSFAEQKRGWVAGDGGFVSHTVDDGLTWTPQTVATKDAINDIYFRNKDNGYLLAGNSIFQTDDGGASWTETRRYFASDFGGATPELYSVRFS